MKSWKFCIFLIVNMLFFNFGLMNVSSLRLICIICLFVSGVVIVFVVIMCILIFCKRYFGIIVGKVWMVSLS